MSLAARTPPVVATIAIVLGALMFGTTAYFGRVLPDMGFAPPAIAFWRFALTAALLSPFLVLRGPGRRATLWGIAGGASLGLGWIGYVAALKLMPVAEAGVLFMTYPLFAILFAAGLFGERPGRRALFAAGLIVAAALVGTPIAAGAISPTALLLGLATPVGYGLLLNIIAHRLGALPSLGAVGAISLGAVLGVAPLFTQLPIAEIVPRSASALWMLLAFSLLTALLPQVVYMLFAPRLGAVRTAIAGSAELPMMFTIGWIAFGEAPTVGHGAAAALIVTAIAITARPPPDALAPVTV